MQYINPHAEENEDKFYTRKKKRYTDRERWIYRWGEIIGRFTDR